jgi:hypothetical protein
MNPDTKMFLEEMRRELAEQTREIRKEFADHSAKWDSRLAAVETKQDEWMDALEQAAKEFESWKPTIESSVQVVKMEVQKLSKHWERTVKEKLDPSLIPSPASGTSPHVGNPPPHLPFPRSVPLRLPAGVQADGPDGHRIESWNRGTGYGSVTYTQIPDKGTSNVPLPNPQLPKHHEFGDNRGGGGRGGIPQGNYLNLIFLCFLVRNPSYGCLGARLILICTMSRSLDGFR